MKTTLKRGVRRAAGANGNGRAVLPPTLAPVTRYRQPAPRRRGALHVLVRIVVWLGVAVLTVGAGLAGGAYLYFEHEFVGKVGARSAEVKEAAERLDVAPAGDPAVALVVGYDKRMGPEAEVTGRSDTVMLLRADPRRKSLSMLSFPRDLAVDVHCPGRAPFREKINGAYEACGVMGTLQTVRALTGVPINYLITVNFRGFKQVVAKIGGVWVDVDRRYFNDNSHGGERYATIDLQPGYQKLNGADSLDYVRFRHTDSDLYRLARQQAFVRAFNEQLRTSFSPTSVPKLVKVITDNVEVGRGGKGDLDPRLLISYGLFAFELPQGNFFQGKVEGLREVDGTSDLYTDPSNIRQAVEEFMHPDVDAPEQATAAALGRKPKRVPAPPPRATSIVVLNGNGVPGAAANASYLLAERGYATLEPPNGQPADAPRQDFAHTTVFVDGRYPRADAAAASVARLFGAAEVAPMPRRGNLRRLAGDAMLAVVVGRTFTGSLAPAATPSVPKRQPPDVRRDPAQALDHLRRVRGRVRFPLLVPTLVESASRIDAELPVRAYKLAGHDAVRMTFLSGKEASAYWGIQMTNWEDAPALDDPNETLTIGRRRYELYYTGAKLHMVVLRANGATYWVVNTLLNSLSNETMLAIAKGLKPLPR